MLETSPSAIDGEQSEVTAQRRSALRATERRRVLRHPATLWSAFAAVHIVLVLLCMYAPGWPIGDVEGVYKMWVARAANGGIQVGIDEPWVYPIVAYVPMALANILGPTFYVQVWLALVVALNAVAFAVLTGGLRRRTVRPVWRIVAAWWWLGFLLLLGPIALARIDSITIPIAILALLIVASRPGIGAALLTIAAWIKVWPAAVVAALLVASRSRFKILEDAVGTTLVVMLSSVVLGGFAYVLSFVTEQTGRGLQLEAPISTFWVWQTMLGVPDARIYYDFEILTFQVSGAGAEIASALMTPLMVLAAASVALLGFMRMRAGAHFVQLFAPLALALVLVLIVFNKVGSPQFMTWLAAPIIIGLIYRHRAWWLPATIGLTLALLTQVIYPTSYNELLMATPWVVLVLTLRNLLQLALLGWAIRAIYTAGRTPAPAVAPALTPSKE